MSGLKIFCFVFLFFCFPKWKLKFLQFRGSTKEIVVWQYSVAVNAISVRHSIGQGVITLWIGLDRKGAKCHMWCQKVKQDPKKKKKKNISMLQNSSISNNLFNVMWYFIVKKYWLLWESWLFQGDLTYLQAPWGHSRLWDPCDPIEQLWLEYLSSQYLFYIPNNMCFIHRNKTKWTHLITFSLSKILQNH